MYDAWLSDTPVKLDKYRYIKESFGKDDKDKQIKSIFNELDSKIERAKHRSIQILEELENSDELETAEQKISLLTLL